MKKTLLLPAAYMAMVLGACATGGTQESTKETETSQASTAGETSSPDSQAGQTAESTAKSAQTMQDAKLTQAQMTQEMVLNQLHHINQKEIQLAQMAQEKAQSPQVKNAAQEILKDHQALEARVQEVAKTQQLQLSNFQPATDEKQMMDRLDKMSGSQFDQAFLQNMHFGHKSAMENLRLARTEVKDPQVRSLIDQALPKISQHRQLSGVIQKNIGSQSQAGIAGES